MLFFSFFIHAGQEGFEPPTGGFGDRCSTNWSYWPKFYVIATLPMVFPRHCEEVPEAPTKQSLLQDPSALSVPRDKFGHTTYVALRRKLRPHLLYLLMLSVLPTEPAILGEFQTIWILLLVFKRAVIPSFTFSAFESYNF